MDIIQTVQDLESDSQSIAKAANEETMVTPRYGDPYKSAPLIIAETEQKAEQALAKIVDNNMMRGFTTEALLKAWVPTYNAYAKAEDTGQIWRYDLAISQWIKSGEGDFEKAKQYTDRAIPEFLQLNTAETHNIFSTQNIVQGFYLSATGSTTALNGYALYVQEVQAGDVFFFKMSDVPSGTTMRFALKDSATPSANQVGTLLTPTLMQDDWYRVQVPSNTATIALYVDILKPTIDLRQTMQIQKDQLILASSEVDQIAGMSVKDTFAREELEQISSNMLETFNAEHSSPFVIVDKRGVPIFDASSSNASTGVDLSKWRFHGSSTLRRMQAQLFQKLSARFPEIQGQLDYAASGGGFIADIATEIGINNSTLTFTSNVINATGTSAVDTTALEYGSGTLFEIPIELQNGVLGTIKGGNFTAAGLSENIALPVGIKIPFESIASKAENYVAFLNIGKNDLASAANTQKVLDATQHAFDYLNRTNDNHTIVMGHFVNRDAAVSQADGVKLVNSHLKALYGKYYFDLQAWVQSEKPWQATGLIKTQADIDAIAAGTLPPSFTEDGIHLIELLNDSLSTEIVNFVETLGWY